MIEAYFDGVCEPVNPGGHAAWGAVVLIDGNPVYEGGGHCGEGPKMSNNVAEYSAFTAALTEAAKHPGPIIIRGDSKLVINQLTGKWKVNGGLYHPFYLKARELYQRERDRLRLEWIPREKNDLCDVLSKKVLLDMGIKFRIQPN